MCCGRVVWDFISVLRFIQHNIDSFNSCESCNITSPLLPCGFHIMAAIQIGRQWHSIQPMNSKLRGWSKTDIEPKKLNSRYYGLMKNASIWHDGFVKSTSSILYSCEIHAALKNSLSTTQAIRHFKMTVNYTQIIQFNSIPHVCCQSNCSYFIVSVQHFRGGCFRTIWFSTISIEDTIWI